jgi:myo-inositol catabolism protein IolC
MSSHPKSAEELAVEMQEALNRDAAAIKRGEELLLEVKAVGQAITDRVNQLLQRWQEAGIQGDS